MPTHAFTRLDCVIDDVHALFDAWSAAGTFSEVLSPEGLEVLRLAVHEWIANLVQHATFPDAVRIELGLTIEGDGVRCRIADSSAGFDIATQIERQQAILDAPAPSERGRGLLMLVTATDDLGFVTPAPDVLQAVSFVVHDPDEDFFASLFRPEDLTADPNFERDIHANHAGDGQTGDVPSPGPQPTRPR